MPGRMRPVLKWPGGKFRLLDAVLQAIPSGKRLVEPFVGSGALFMNAPHKAYLLCDSNRDCIEFHRCLAEGGGDFIGRCRELFDPAGNCAEEFYARRGRFNRLEHGVERADETPDIVVVQPPPARRRRCRGWP